MYRTFFTGSQGQQGSNLETIAYDAKNRVVSRTFNGLTTYYIYDKWNLIEEYSSGSLQYRYVHGPKKDELISRDSGSGQTVYYFQDGSGSVVALSSTTGAILERYSYDAYGQVSFADGSNNPIASSAYANRFLYTGREFISELNLYDYRNRVYSMSLGRFLQADPIKFEGGDVNIYRYVNNNAPNFIDPYGLLSLSDWGNIASGVGGIAIGVGAALAIPASPGIVTGALLGLSAGALMGLGNAQVINGASGSPINYIPGDLPSLIVTALGGGQQGGARASAAAAAATILNPSSGLSDLIQSTLSIAQALKDNNDAAQREQDQEDEASQQAEQQAEDQQTAQETRDEERDQQQQQDQNDDDDSLPDQNSDGGRSLKFGS